MSKVRLKLAVLALLAVAPTATGCVPALVQNRSMEPDTATPAKFPGQAQAEAEAGAKGPEASFGTRDWRDVFTSPELRGLIDEALRKNQELNIRLQELVIAQAEVTARRGEYMPKVGVGATVGGDRVSGSSSQGVNDEAVGLPSTLGNFGFGLVGSWEVDIWGKLRNGAASANYRYLAAGEGRNFLITQLVAEIARTYYELLAYDTKIDALKHNIDLQTHALELIRIEKQAARVTELAVQRFEAEVLKNKSVLYDLEQERVLAQNRLNFLVGRYPQPVARDPKELNAPLPHFLRAGVPASLLENRPDVRQAELQLEAAKLDVKAARANFFPSLSIDGSLGFGAFNPAHLLDPGSLVAGLAGRLTAPLINRSAIEAQYTTANAVQIQALVGYERSLLQAFTDVTNSLSNVTNKKNSFAVRSQQVARLQNSVELSNTLFKAARADYVEVLLVRRDLVDAQMELIDRRLELKQSVVNLYQALGGGWRPSAAAPAPAKPQAQAKPKPQAQAPAKLLPAKRS